MFDTFRSFELCQVMWRMRWVACPACFEWQQLPFVASNARCSVIRRMYRMEQVQSVLPMTPALVCSASTCRAHPSLKSTIG